MYSRAHSIGMSHIWQRGFQGGSAVKNSPANARNLLLIPGSRRSLGEKMANHTSVLAREIPWTEEAGGL